MVEKEGFSVLGRNSESRNKLHYCSTDLVAHSAKFGKDFFFGASCFGGIIKRPVKALSITRKDRTIGGGIIAHCYQVVELPPEIFS